MFPTFFVTVLHLCPETIIQRIQLVLENTMGNGGRGRDSNLNRSKQKTQHPISWRHVRSIWRRRQSVGWMWEHIKTKRKRGLSSSGVFWWKVVNIFDFRSLWRHEQNFSVYPKVNTTLMHLAKCHYYPTIYLDCMAGGHRPPNVD